MKITPEIEAVAKAMYDLGPAYRWIDRDSSKVEFGSLKAMLPPVYEKYVIYAIAAICALREPTEKQVDAERKYLAMSDAGYPWKYGKTYTIMIDAALGEKNEDSQRA